MWAVIRGNVNRLGLGNKEIGHISFCELKGKSVDKSRKTESGPRPGKEQDLGLNRINCPYFVPSVAKLAQGSKDVKARFTLST
ncbi:hypothetical protein F383_14247 [Gossypium arboreum]|uniref:Uncharacterized protein n=1 Tax=Gossypium arboreum TaxID=29729 RepID=A0A0B0Q0M4_GOSAR|nr:hypothetical protein F383_14247 [Gossypium arboreum]